MAEGRVRYSMDKLRVCAEIDAAKGCDAIGEGAYFDLLTEFLSFAPGAAAGLSAPSGEGETPAFLRKIQELRERLVGIRAPGIVDEIDKAVELAKTGNKTRCGNKLYLIASTVKSLCGKIERSKAGLPPGAAAQIHVPAASQPSPQSLPAAIAAEAVRSSSATLARINPEPFEKLSQLINSFEIDEAKVHLASLMRAKYTEIIDAVLESINSCLTKFDYDGAARQTGLLLDAAKDAKGKSAAQKKILAIDDVPDVLNVVKSVLKGKYAVYGVINHMAALKFLTTNSADLILMDIEMPDMNGFELLGLIRKIKQFESTPIIFLTSSATVENIKRSLQGGANDFIRKPIDAQVLMTKVAKYLG